MSALQSLLVRVESATGPNFELERALFETLAMPEEWFGARVTDHFRIGDGYGFNTEDGFRHLDAIKTPALALIAAMLKALVAQGEDGKS